MGKLLLDTWVLPEGPIFSGGFLLASISSLLPNRNAHHLSAKSRFGLVSGFRFPAAPHLKQGGTKRSPN